MPAGYSRYWTLRQFTGSCTSVQAYRHDEGQGHPRGVLVGKQGHEKRLKDTYGSEADALAPARAEMNRIARGAATLELSLAVERPELMPQTPVSVKGFKGDIDRTDWLVVRLSHQLVDQGLATRVEMETYRTSGDTNEPGFAYDESIMQP